MIRSFWLPLFKLQLLQARKRLPVFGIMAIILSVFILLGVYVALFVIGGNHLPKVDIVIATEDDQPLVVSIVRTANEMPDISAYAQIKATTKEAALNAVQNRQAVAAIILPAGVFREDGSFYDNQSADDSKWPIEIVTNSSKQLETTKLLKIIDCSIAYFEIAVQGVDYVMSVADTTMPDKHKELGRMEQVQKEADATFLYWITGSTNLLEYSVMDITGQLSLVQHYLLSLLLFFLMLMTPVFYNHLSLIKERSWIRRLKTQGLAISSYILIKLTSITCIIMVSLLILLTASRVISNVKNPFLIFSFLPGLFLSSWLLATIAFICCNIGSIITAVGLNFILTLSLIILAGGLIPKLFLPVSIAMIADYTPFALIMDLMSGIFGFAPKILSFILLSLMVLLTSMLCLMRGQQIERKYL